MSCVYIGTAAEESANEVPPGSGYWGLTSSGFKAAAVEAV